MSKTLTNEDLCRAAKRLGTTTAEVQTFLAVETKGKGFDEGRVVILFERHWFHKFTGGKYDATDPDISNATDGGYNNGGSQHDRFSKAFALDAQAAMRSASWGIGQVMGFNYAICGYPSVDAFVDAMKTSEGKQLDASIEFICHNNLDGELRGHDWKGFARGYNGKDFAKNHYDTKLAVEYSHFSAELIDCSKTEAEPAGDPANESKTVNEGEHVEDINPSPSVVDPAQPSSLSTTATVQKVAPSLTERIAAATAFLTGLGINAGSLIQSKLQQMTLAQIGYLLAALGLCAFGAWWYRHIHKSADKMTHTLVAAAANRSLNTVELKQ